MMRIVMTLPMVRHILLGIGVISTMAFVSSCKRSQPDQVQGYVEGEFVYVASPFAGQLDALFVERGAHVNSGAPLFALNATSETAARDQAAHQLAQAEANLTDVKKGKRPTEIESIQAQLDQARAALELSEAEYQRSETLIKTGAVSRQGNDQNRFNRDRDRLLVTQLQADLQTARLGQRSDQIAAAEEEVKARRASLAQMEWNLAQKHQTAPESGLVFDTLYWQGEWVDAGRPIIALLPPENVKVRAFISQGRIGSVHVGDPVSVKVDGVTALLTGKISFISPHAEYTPPVIYSEQSRDKLVFMVEIVFDRQTAQTLHPGQPVDVVLNSTTGATP